MFQPNVCNRCHDLLKMSVNLSNIAILNIKGSDYCCIFGGASKNEAISLMQNSDLTKKDYQKYKSFIKSIKMFYKVFLEGVKGWGEGV